MRWVEETDTAPSVTVGYAWDESLRVTHQFEASRRYILLAPPLDTEGIDHIAALGNLPWSMVFDFVPDSESTGLQKAIGPALESHRSLHRVVLRDRPTLNPERSTYWFMLVDSLEGPRRLLLVHGENGGGSMGTN